MSNGLRRLLASCAIVFFAFVPSIVAATIPAGTPLEIRIQQPISSYSTPAGTKITGILISPVSEGGRILVPLGTTIEGSVVKVRRVGLGFAHETAEIELRFDHIVLSGQAPLPIEVRLTAIENARESINKKGRIQGIRSTSTLSNRTSGIVGSLAFGDPIAAIFTTAGSASVLRFSEPEITLPAGAELLAQVVAPVDLQGGETEILPPVVTSEEGRQELGEMVHRLPFRTFTSGKKEIPSDFTNLVFIGSSDALEHAFAASGWVVVDSLTAETTYSTIRSVAENQGYQRAPMSILLLNGEPPQYAYAKTLNTFSKRHHLRIWKTKETWQGQPVWTSSSTHDIGIGFSKKNKTFIHLIDTNIDSERAKVVNDFIYTGCVSNAQLVTRPWLPKDAKNGTGEDLITDGRAAVLQLNDCAHPLGEANENSIATLRTHGNRVERTTRQTVLTLKNNILRDNVGVMAYSGIRYGLDAKKRQETAPARQMNINGEQYTIDTGFHSREAYTTLTPHSESESAPNPKANLWTPPSVELGLRGGFLGYYGGNGGAVGYVLTSDNPDDILALVMANTLHDGWTIGGSVTLNPKKYFSHEFSYDHSFTEFNLGLAIVGHDSTSEEEVALLVFEPSGLRTSQFTYNLLFNFRPRTSRLRPYIAAGPSLQLMHLADAPIKKAPGWFKLGLSNIGLISAAYNFGSDPPLDGGGIFRAGFNYGGGVRYRMTPRWMIRADYRETLIAQPDFWTKSQDDILSGIDVDPGWELTVLGPVLDGAMRQDRVTMGLSFTF